MSKTITIPTTMSPFAVIVNGVKHEYPAGKTVAVPDHIAEIIEEYEKGSFPRPQLPVTVINMISPGGKAFAVTIDDNGNLIAGKGKIIAFEIAGKRYIAEEGMPWSEWCGSDYCLEKEECPACGGSWHKTYSVNGDGVVYQEQFCHDCKEASEVKPEIKDSDGKYVRGDNVIVANEKYGL